MTNTGDGTDDGTGTCLLAEVDGATGVARYRHGSGGRFLGRTGSAAPGAAGGSDAWLAWATTTDVPRLPRRVHQRTARVRGIRETSFELRHRPTPAPRYRRGRNRRASACRRTVVPGFESAAPARRTVKAGGTEPLVKIERRPGRGDACAASAWRCPTKACSLPSSDNRAPAGLHPACSSASTRC